MDMRLLIPDVELVEFVVICDGGGGGGGGVLLFKKSTLPLLELFGL